MAETTREQRLQEILVEYLESAETSPAPNREEWLARYPEFATELAEYFAGRHKLEQLAAGDAPTVAPQHVVEPGAQARAAESLARATGSAVQPGVKLRYVGDYELLEEIARGGMGVVYKARQVKLKRTVAVKMILAGELANQTDVERFHTEARAAANLHHPNIVAIHEVGQHEGHHYFSMDYVAGESLAHKIARGPLPPREAAALLKKVAQAVAFAHVEGVIHRDLKPANILLDAAGQPHVTDFGLAKRVQSEPGASATGADLTQTGQVLGTPSYMPPEQAGGKSKEIGPRSDVYSLGAVLYCALTGRPPFQAASTLDTLLQVLDREPVSPRSLNSTVPRDLETICLKCLQKEPRRRYASARELANELGRFLEGKPILARPVSSPERFVRWCRRNPTLAGLQFALGLACVLMVFIALLAIREANWSAELAGIAIDRAADAKKAEDRATAQERLTRRHLFSAHTNLAHEALKNDNVSRVLELLNDHVPKADQDDLRSFDWRYLWRECQRQQKTIPLFSRERVKIVQGQQTTEADLRAGAISISPNGQLVAVGIFYRHLFRGAHMALDEVRLLDIPAGTLRKTIKQPDQLFSELLFSADSRLFATVSGKETRIKRPWGSESQHSLTDPQLLIWDTKTMKLRNTIPLPSWQLGDRIALAPNNKVVAAALESKEEEKKQGHRIMAWDLPERDNAPVGKKKLLAQPEQSQGGYRFLVCFAFTPDSKALAWSRVGDGADGNKKLTLTDVTGAGNDTTLPVYSDGLTFSPDGKYLATANEAGNFTGDWRKIKLLDAKTGKEIHAFPLSPLRYISLGAWDHYVEFLPRLRFSQSGRTLAVAHGLSLQLWDVASKKQIGDIHGHTDLIRALGFGADGKTIISVAGTKRGLDAGFMGRAAESYEAKVWDINTRPGPDEFLVAGQAPKGHRFAAMNVSPDGKTLAALWIFQDFGTSSAALTLHDISAGTLGKQLLHLKSGPIEGANYAREFFPQGVRFSGDGKRLILTTGRKYFTHPLSAAWFEKLQVHKGKHIQLWRLASGHEATKAALQREFYALQRNPSDPAWAALSPDGTKLAYSFSQWSHNKEFDNYDLGTTRLEIYDCVKDTVTPLTESWIPDWKENNEGVVFSSDGKRFFTGMRGLIVAWDTSSGKAVGVLQVAGAGRGIYVQGLVLSPDGKTFANWHQDHSIRLWDVSESKLREGLDKFKQRQEAAKSGKEPAPEPAAQPKAILRGHSDTITAVAFHPDGKMLASASNDHTIKLWDTVTGEVRLTLEGHTANIATISFTPDGNTLISTDAGGTVKVWRAVMTE